MSDNEMASHLAENVRGLRERRGLTQAQLAKLAGLPRATWSHLESGAANPTLSVLRKVAAILQVSVEELISARSTTRLHRKEDLPVRALHGAAVRRLLPDRIPGMELDRLEIQPGARIAGIPHTPGTREWLTCESGMLVLWVGGEKWQLGPGDVVTFRGDQRHSYVNPGARVAVGYSVVVLAWGQ
jgi:transcriptional regulator with XRE-family HTH domain